MGSLRFRLLAATLLGLSLALVLGTGAYLFDRYRIGEYAAS
jgi:hypothetical protein